ncbi:hypothetical protein FBU30_001921 [Linnemannia zychae]|nr:hypothetical protein FBU30_001921 [Linnemannia zychae]
MRFTIAVIAALALATVQAAPTASDAEAAAIEKRINGKCVYRAGVWLCPFGYEEPQAIASKRAFGPHCIRMPNGDLRCPRSDDGEPALAKRAFGPHCIQLPNGELRCPRSDE